MNPRQFFAGVGAFLFGAAGLVAAAVFGEAYVRRQEETGGTTIDADAAPPASPESQLIEAPHVAERRDGQVEAAPAAVIRGGAPSAGASPSGDASDPAAHVPTDLMGDHHPGPDERAPVAFRPDPTAPVPPDLRESLRPATGPAPSLVANEGESVTEAVNPG